MKPVWISLFNLLSCSCFVSGTHLCGICRECLAKSSVIQEGTRGGPKNNRSYFLKWFIRFYTITTLVSFKVFSFWLDTLLPTFFPLLKTFMELFSADVQDFSVFFFTSLTSAKFFPFIWPFIWGNRKKLHGAKSGEWIGRMRDNRHVVFFAKNYCTLKAVWAGALLWWRNQSPLLHIFGRFFCTLSLNLFSTFK